MKACANLSTMFADLPFMERFGAARTAGFQGVEVPFPYDHAVPDMLDMLGRNDLDFVMITCPPPNYTGAERGFAAVPGQEARFQRDFKRTLRYAKALKVRHIHVMSGAVQGPEARETLIKNLRWAVSEAPKQSLTLEPMCQEDVPGYYLNNAVKAAEIVREVSAMTLGLQFDVHHVHQMHGNVLAMWADLSDVVTHIQLAQSPSRAAPHAPGDVDIKAFLKAVKASGCKGWIAGEYMTDPRDTDHAFWV